MIIIGSARHDENRHYSGGKAGDQKQKLNSAGYDMSGEVSTQPFYVHRLGWDILRAKDPKLANGLAFSMALACVNKNIGYNQNKRLGVVNKGILTDVPVNADCSSLVRACIQNCGHKIDNFTTVNEVAILLATGLFEKVAYLTQDALYNGDILVTKTKGHTVIVVSGARERLMDSTKTIYPEPTSIVKKGDKGDEVKWVQNQLKTQGATDIKIDGDFGRITEMWVRAFQHSHNLEPDGIVGDITRKYLKVKWN